MTIIHPLRFPLLLIVLLALVLLPSASRAQPVADDAVAGTKYVIAFPDTTANILDSRYPNNKVKEGVFLLLYSSVEGNKVKITSGSGASTAVTLGAGKFLAQEVKINPVVAVSNQIQYNTILLESERPIIVYCYFATKQSCEAWTPIPVDRWGTEYNVAATVGDVVKDVGIAGQFDVPFYRKGSHAEFLIVAAYDNTHVMVNNFGRKFHANPDYTFTLGENQCYQIQGDVDTAAGAARQVDIGGTLIQADKPIGVISGNSRSRGNGADTGITGNAWKNMMMEWISPIEQHGTKFVYMPTWDDLRPGGGAKVTRDTEYVRIYGTYGSSSRDSTSVRYTIGSVEHSFKVAKDTLVELPIHPSQAVYFETDHPAMAMMHSASVVRTDTTYSVSGGRVNRAYSGTAPYMTELTPREQWTSFAPFYAPTTPSGMNHYINVVTDTASANARKIVLEDGTPFPFDRAIAGSDLAWGTMPVTPGITHTLTGTGGARFAGHVYGLYRGTEKIHFGGVPAEYEEYNALSYGYPLSPLRNVLRSPDSLQIDTVMETESLLHITIRSLNANPVGLRSILLDPSSVINAKIVPVDPTRLSNIVGKTQVLLDIMPINELEDASATVIIKYRTGAVHYIYFNYRAQVLVPDRDTIDFGDVKSGTSPMVTIAYRNLRDFDISADELRSVGKYFTVVNPPPFPSVVKPGDSLTAIIRFNGDNPSGIYRDSLLLRLGAIRRWVYLRARIVATGPASGVDDDAVRKGYAFDGARPNPASGRTEIAYRLGASGVVNVAIYNAAGERVALLVDGVRSAGEGRLTWDASALPSGVYYCRIRAGEWSASRAIVVAR